MFCDPEGQRVIQTWSHFNRNHSSFLGKRRISGELFFFFFKITKYPFPEDLCWHLAGFSFHLTQIFWSSRGNLFSDSVCINCLPKINEVLSFKTDAEEVRWEENGHNPKKKFLETNHSPKSCRWGSLPALFHFLQWLFVTRRTFSLKICSREKETLQEDVILLLPQVRWLCHLPGSLGVEGSGSCTWT